MSRIINRSCVQVHAKVKNRLKKLSGAGVKKGVLATAPMEGRKGEVPMRNPGHCQDVTAIYAVSVAAQLAVATALEP
jgi:hypothetical protein